MELDLQKEGEVNMSEQSVFKNLGEVYKNRSDVNFSKEFSYKVKKNMGVTIGNALRRTLLGQVSGYAIRYFNISNVNHEFSNISGMYESVQTLIMNLRKVVFKNLSEDPITKGYAFLRIKDIEGAIDSSFITSSDFVVVNKNVHLCSLTTDVELNIEMYIERGIGHVLSSNVSASEYERDVIICDSFFSPIEEVNYSVESIENNTCEEELFVSILTNGSVSPDEAMDQAIIIWRDELTKISNKIIEIPEDENEYIGSSYKPIKVHNAYLDARIKSIPDVSARIASCLDALNVEYVGQLVTMTEDDLLSKPNFGRGSLKDLIRILNNIGLSLGMTLDNWKCPDSKNHSDEESVLIG